MNPEPISVALKPEKKNFDFVDTIRCISMMGIVYEHCVVIGEDNYSNFYSTMFQASAIQFFKFATIAFFIIGGFLINHKFTEYTPGEYIKNRFKSTIGPWFFWLNAFVLVDVISFLYKKFFLYKGDYEPSKSILNYIIERYVDVMFFTSFWFILNFLICICILLLFKKYLYNLYFGITLLVISLFYSVNLYHGWIMTPHNTALFGFIFYLWLGVIMNKHYTDLKLFIQKTNFWYFIVITVVFFLLADFEIVHLKNLGNKDAFNTLRITNILYSLSFFLLLLKIGSISALNKWIAPRKTTFGVYLTHQIIITLLLVEILRPFKIHMEELTLLGGALLGILRFVITYFVAMVVVLLIARTKFKWSIGIFNNKSIKQSR
ncbi:acyltransferase [Pedobacter sp. MC2016-14]|uniref:acyltransferase family protein n=1 Tax=Pedobacter sp. MC2016-14 TaxID=2897327 RepID=UPI001E3D47EF|nr:acyltransferase [Pedobacter sp. MC2016-14]MCD0487106.1 acyltransferase [Pedobacter sp. MC2016-14]